jgi:hypothetical protein
MGNKYAPSAHADGVLFWRFSDELPTLTTPETQRLRSDYPCIEHLEAGNIASWLMERQEQLLIRAKDERTGMNLAKLIIPYWRCCGGGLLGYKPPCSHRWHNRRCGVCLGSCEGFE